MFANISPLERPTPFSYAIATIQSLQVVALVLLQVGKIRRFKASARSPKTGRAQQESFKIKVQSGRMERYFLIVNGFLQGVIA